MAVTLQTEHFKQALTLLLDETFDKNHDFYLDPGTSLFETLETISAEEASIPVGVTCATLAAQVAHVAFYLEVNERAVREGSFPKVDWDEIWHTTKEVDADQWEALKKRLRQSYRSTQTLIKTIQDWPSEFEISNAIGWVVHTAYHLGEIRQALCMLKG
ncbi:MAG TPA: DinB family protein [Anaerolineales bacterium]|jgi:hypothetical protein|nr:DinB family protein [Anaerolineales bacterium]